ncbi:hypothetical protein CWS02_10710 [Enterobacter sp. EA-1]|nr:hypothetical protein CWS02_10710 [Enterobacter sp. EA-1]
MPIVIRELGWYKGTPEQNQWVRVAPMDAPDQYQQVNIHHAMLTSAQHSLTHFSQWKDPRMAGGTHPALAIPSTDRCISTGPRHGTDAHGVRFPAGEATLPPAKNLHSIAAY